MKIKRNDFNYACFVVVAILALFVSICAITSGAIILSAVASIFLFLYVERLFYYKVNIFVLFILTYFLYSLSGPIACHWGNGLSSVFPKPYLINEFMLYYILGLLGIGTGAFFYFNFKPDCVTLSNTNWLCLNRKKIFLMVLFFSGCSSLFELINLFRVGGVDALFRGKAFYQSAVSDLSFDLPSIETMTFSFVLFGLWFISFKEKADEWGRVARRHLLLFLIMLPVLFDVLILGRRGTILMWAAILLFAKYYFKNPKLSLRHTLLFLLFYCVLCSLFLLRSQVGYLRETHDFGKIVEYFSDIDRVVSSSNPATNEFGAPFGNFNTFLLAGKNDFLLGKSYWWGVLSLVPRSLLPARHQTITYDFRDEFFADWGGMGAIAGTGFSSLLDAYWNWGSIGVFVVFFIFGLALSWLELERRKNTSPYFVLFYLLLVPNVIEFHRQELGVSLFSVLLYVFVFYVAYSFNLRSSKRG